MEPQFLSHGFKWPDAEKKQCATMTTTGAPKPALGTVGKTRRFASASRVPSSITNRMGWDGLSLTHSAEPD